MDAIRDFRYELTMGPLTDVSCNSLSHLSLRRSSIFPGLDGVVIDRSFPADMYDDESWRSIGWIGLIEPIRSTFECIS